MRSEKISEFIDVLLALHNAPAGLTYQDINRLTENSSPRSAQRMIETIETALNVSVIETRDPANYKVKRFRLPRQDLTGLVRFSPEELIELETAIDILEKSNHASGAKAVHGILQKIKAVIDRPGTIESDLEFLRRSELAVAEPRLRQQIDPAIFHPLREALLAEREVEIVYQKVHSDVVAGFTVHPYGLIYGKRNYLVAFNPAFNDIRHYALTHVKSVQLLAGKFDRPEDFDLQAHMADSIGVFREEPVDILLRFAPEAKPDVLNFHFHQSQQLKERDDGQVEVYLHAGGLKELCYHLFTWGAAVKILKPARLRTLYRDMLREAGRSSERT